MGFGIIFVNMDFLGFKIDSPKIHGNVDMEWVTNEMRSRGVKNLSSTPSIFFFLFFEKVIIFDFKV